MGSGEKATKHDDKHCLPFVHFRGTAKRASDWPSFDGMHCHETREDSAKDVNRANAKNFPSSMRYCTPPKLQPLSPFRCRSLFRSHTTSAPYGHPSAIPRLQPTAIVLRTLPQLECDTLIYFQPRGSDRPRTCVFRRIAPPRFLGAVVSPSDRHITCAIIYARL